MRPWSTNHLKVSKLLFETLIDDTMIQLTWSDKSVEAGEDGSQGDDWVLVATFYLNILTYLIYCSYITTI